MSGGPRRRRKRKKPRPGKGEPIGLLEADALLAHRELAFLRDAARAGSGRVSTQASRSLAIRAAKLKEARRVAEKYGKGANGRESPPAEA